jgi:hypothetical protein
VSANTDPAGCTGKKRYRSFVAAEVAALRSAKSNEAPMHAYHCRPCNSFHVGTHFAPKKPEPPLEEICHDD